MPYGADAISEYLYIARSPRVHWMSMPLFQPTDWHFAKTVSEMAFSNPFLPRRIDLERQALGDEFVEIADEFIAGSLSADALLSRYITMVYAQTRSYVTTAQRLGIDRRTVKARVDRELLNELG